jgi:hypothetical protein
VFINPKKKFASIIFHTAPLAPSKKGSYDFILNLQHVMTDNNLIFSSFLSLKPNDFLVLEEVIEKFKETLQIQLELVKKYCERKNYKEIEKIMETPIFNFDTGYVSDESIEKAHEIGIKALIKPKKIAIENNIEFKSKRGIVKKNR